MVVHATLQDTETVLMRMVFQEPAGPVVPARLETIIGGVDDLFTLMYIFKNIEVEGSAVDREFTWRQAQRAGARIPVVRFTYNSPPEIILAIGGAGSVAYLAALRLLRVFDGFQRSRVIKAEADTAVSREKFEQWQIDQALHELRRRRPRIADWEGKEDEEQQMLGTSELAARTLAQIERVDIIERRDIGHL